MNDSDAICRGSVTWLDDPIAPKISCRAFKGNYVTFHYGGCSISRDLQL
jgi:hypothetical protein